MTIALTIDTGIGLVSDTTGSVPVNQFNPHSLLFDGINERLLTSNVTMSNATPLTFSWWHKNNKLNGWVMTNSSNDSGPGITIRTRNRPVLDMWIGDGSIRLGRTWTLFYDYDRWFHFLFTYDGNQTSQLYRDSTLMWTVNNASFNPNNIAKTGSVSIASKFTEGGKWNNAFLDELTWWDAYFLQADVDELYASRSIINPTTHSKSANLKHWWRMGERFNGSTQLDEVGSADATAYNMDTSNIRPGAP